jgi:hypothetical protein
MLDLRVLLHYSFFELTDSDAIDKDLYPTKALSSPASSPSSSCHSKSIMHQRNNHYRARKNTTNFYMHMKEHMCNATLIYTAYTIGIEVSLAMGMTNME